MVGGSVQVGDVLLGDDEGLLGMHGWTSFGVWCGHCDPRGLQRACSPVNAPAGHRNRGRAVRGVRWTASDRDRYGRQGVCVSASWDRYKADWA